MKAFPLRFRQGCENRAEKLRELRSLRYILELCSPSVPFTHDRVKLDGTLVLFPRLVEQKKGHGPRKSGRGTAATFGAS